MVIKKPEKLFHMLLLPVTKRRAQVAAKVTIFPCIHKLKALYIHETNYHAWKN
jgi:hypothetical protein